MKSAISAIIAAAVIGAVATWAMANGLRESVLRDAAIDAGLVPADQTHVPVTIETVTVGKLLFESRLLAFNRDTACATCHIDRFGSADGLPNAIGTKGKGSGADRIANGGDIVPRNVLPLWGRGSLGFDVLFWDGKVSKSAEGIHSQFGGAPPADDTLTVAVHLPPVEIDEMVIDRGDTKILQTEDVSTAVSIYADLAERIRSDTVLGPALANARRIKVNDITFIDIAISIADFIRFNYRLRDTRLHNFVFGLGKLTDAELEGGLLFYGRGGCASCHNGPYFSDQQFHAVPFPQVGFGRNGFGVDYGRFNVTLDEADRYRFRTPPLYNVATTSPYGHSGSIRTLSDAVRVHIDPLVNINPKDMSTNERNEFYERLKIWSVSPLNGVVMNEREISAISEFLRALSYESALPVEIVD